MIQYRREIDGLRALAVVPVILFHAGAAAFAGGFVGVDVFFVISGYLITSLILAEKAAGKFSLIGFYERRARRILPALFLVMFACLPFAWAWLVPADLKSFSANLMAVPAFASNIVFWLRAGYFTPSAELDPLMHTWSLAVEEQYYVLFPAVLLLMWEVGRRWLIGTLVVGAVVSLALAEWASKTHPTAAFYLLPTRAWELLIGALTAFYLFGKAPAISPVVRQCLGVLGLGLIVYAVFAFGRDTPFPGLHAVVPTAGAALVILCATDDTLVGKLLGTSLLVGIGLISYSAYLWHQPLFAFARQRAADEPRAMLLVALGAASLVLAFLTWRYVETPFRKRDRIGRKPVFAFATVGSVAFVLLGSIGQTHNGFENRAELLAKVGAIGTVENSRCHTTQRRSAAQLASGDVCTLGTGQVPTFAVIGDSHAGAMFEAIAAWHAKSPFAFYAVSGSYCAPLSNGFAIKTKFAAPDCAATTQAAIDLIARSKTINTVFLVAEWANYTEGYRDTGDGVASEAVTVLDRDGEAGSVGENPRVLERSLVLTLASLKSAGKRVVIVEPVPEFHRNVMRTISKHALLNGNPPDLAAVAPSISLAEYRARNAAVFRTFADLRDVTFIEVAQLFCDAEVCHSVASNGDVLYSDTNHLTEPGASRIVAKMMEQLGT